MALRSHSRSRLAPSLTLHLPRAALVRRDAVARLAATWQARKLFAFKCDELTFARDLLAKRSNLWLYRTSQRAFAGDFIVVDLSSPSAAGRLVTVVELKLGEPLRETSRAAVQFQGSTSALRELVSDGVITDTSPVRAITGDRKRILAFLS